MYSHGMLQLDSLCPSQNAVPFRPVGKPYVHPHINTSSSVGLLIFSRGVYPPHGVNIWRPIDQLLRGADR
jgi:hypothetical protein